MENVNILVIGAGVVGLAVARRLSEEFDDVVVVEKEPSFGRHTSSRNSEVIHSGIYYPNNSLKAALCVKGNQMLYDYAAERGVPCERCGKLVVATSDEEKDELIRLQKNGTANGVQNLTIIDGDEVNALEPSVKAIAALKVESTGIIDTHKLMYKMEKDVEANDGFIVYDMRVINIIMDKGVYNVLFEDGEVFRCRYIVNCSGLYSNDIITMLKLDKDNPELMIQWCKGEYYKTNIKRDIHHLIYPVPDPKGVYLGIHLTKNLNNELRFGPNAYYVDEIDYKFDEQYKSDFHKAINNYLDLDEEELYQDDCGIRPKLQKKGEDFRDFYIKEETDKGYPGLINLIGIESPGLTSALAIAEFVAQLI